MCELSCSGNAWSMQHARLLRTICRSADTHKVHSALDKPAPSHWHPRALQANKLLQVIRNLPECVYAARHGEVMVHK